MNAAAKLTAEQVATLAADLAEIKRINGLIDALATRRAIGPFARNVAVAAVQGLPVVRGMTEGDIDEIGRAAIDGMITGLTRRWTELQARIAPFVEVPA